MRAYRFYPGMAMPNLAQIADDDRPAGSIEAPGPEFETGADFSSSSARASATDIHGRSIRATRVVGSLDHAVLPMPPVSPDKFCSTNNNLTVRSA